MLAAKSRHKNMLMEKQCTRKTIPAKNKNVDGAKTSARKSDFG